jgi:hypothetical protein
VARVLVLSGDLLFGSNVQGALTAAGHDVEALTSEKRLRERLTDATRPSADVLVVDLTDEDLAGAGIVAELASTGELRATRTLGFYSHVDVAARESAEQAGFDLVVPRSRMAREGAALVTRLATGS